jgi:polysaccharide biosynthesis/export protein
MKRILSITAFLPLLLSFGCAAPVEESGEAEVAAEAPAQPAAGSAKPSPRVEAPAASTPPIPTEVPVYRIGPGDRVEIKVFKHEDLSGVFEVLSDGTIRYPLIGSLRIGDLTVKEASDRLEAALEQNYLVEAQLSLGVKEYLSRPVTVLGSVQRPGKYYLKAQTTLMDVITEAGGLRDDAGDVVVLSRKIQDRRGASTVRTWNLNVTELLRASDGSTSVPLAEGDVINVPQRTLFTVYGEVLKPGSYRLQRGMTLLKAISEAGGLGKFASKKAVEVHRKVDDGAETVLRYNLARIEDQDDPDPEISAGDTIVVPRRFF